LQFYLIVNINICGNIHMHPHSRTPTGQKLDLHARCNRERIEARLSKANQSPKSVHVAKSK